MKRFVCFLLLFTVLFGTAHASKTKKYLRRCKSCMQESTQVKNNILLAKKYAQQLQQYDVQIRQLENSLIQAKTVTGILPWSNTENLIRQSIDVSRSMDALSTEMTEAEQQMHEDYPEYRDLQTGQGTDFYSNYSKLSARSTNSFKAAVTVGGMQMDNIKNEMDVVRRLREMSNSAEGQMQAQQIANQIAVEKLEDAKKLRQLIIVQNNAMNAYLMKRQNKRMLNMKMQQDFLKEMKADGF